MFGFGHFLAGEEAGEGDAEAFQQAGAAQVVADAEDVAEEVLERALRERFESGWRYCAFWPGDRGGSLGDPAAPTIEAATAPAVARERAP